MVAVSFSVFLGMFHFIYLCIFLMFIFERERESAGAERDGDRGSEAGSALTADVGLELMNWEIMT